MFAVTTSFRCVFVDLSRVTRCVAILVGCPFAMSVLPLPRLPVVHFRHATILVIHRVGVRVGCSCFLFAHLVGFVL